MKILQVHVFSTAPQSADIAPAAYRERVAQVARWSEEVGCKGVLIYTDNRLIDPWLVAQIVIENTQTLCPLVAIQPVYMHPYSVAKMVCSLGYLYGRKVYLNMVAGGFRTDLVSLCDDTPHDMRYERLLEYTRIIKCLLAGERVTFHGKLYKVENLALTPPLVPDLFPGIFVSGSSEAGMATARSLEATAIEYPQLGEEYATASSKDRSNAGIRIGIIAAEDASKAWKIAHERFPGDRRGQIAHKMAMMVSDSHWHKQLSELDSAAKDGDSPYWLWPFTNYSTFCPYLVGSYDEVSNELVKYIKSGFTNFILDIPAQEWDLQCAAIVFREAVQKAGLLQSGS